MSKRPIRRQHRRFSRKEKTRLAEEARKVEAEFPPGRQVPAHMFDDATTLGEYLDLQELCAELRRAREARGMSLADVQKLTGIDVAALSRLERGETPNPTIGTLARVARVMGCRLGLALVESESK